MPTLLQLTRRTGLAAVAFFAGLAPAVAADAPDPEIADLQEITEEIREWERSRDLDRFQLDFKPLRFDRIVLTRREAEPLVFHYMTFRLRNQIIDDAKFLQESHAGFYEVMQQIEETFAGRVKFDTTGGPRLFTTDAEQIENPDLATIVESQEFEDRARTVNITAVAYDENGSRFNLFDPPVEVEGGLSFKDRDLYHFEDLGEAREGNVYHRVRAMIEERERMRLLTVHQIRERPLPSYRRGNPLNEEGVAEGEVYGVLIFDRLPPEGDRFEVRIQGLSNKLRFRGMVPNQGTPEPRDQIQDYVNARVLRRTYVTTYERPGDEYFRDQDDFVLRDSGWRWLDAMVRLRHRRSIAYSKYFLDNHPLQEPATEPEGRDLYAKQGGQPAPLLHDKEVHEAFRQYFGQTDQQLGELYQEELARVEAQRQTMKSRYEALREGDRLGVDELAKREAEWNKAYDERRATLEAGRKKAADLQLQKEKEFTWLESLDYVLQDKGDQ